MNYLNTTGEVGRIQGGGQGSFLFDSSFYSKRYYFIMSNTFTGNKPKIYRKPLKIV